MDRFSERGKGQVHQFKMLPPEGYTNNGDTKQQAQKQVCNCNPESAKDQPDNIHDGGQTSCI